MRSNRIAGAGILSLRKEEMLLVGFVERRDGDVVGGMPCGGVRACGVDL